MFLLPAWLYVVRAFFMPWTSGQVGPKYIGGARPAADLRRASVQIHYTLKN